MIPFALAAFFVGGFFFYKGLKSLKRKRLIENTPTSKVRSTAVGLVEVFGVATACGANLVSPLSKKECVYYKYVVREKNMLHPIYGFLLNSWRIIGRGESNACFYLRDDTGQILVSPVGADIEVARHLKLEMGLKPENPPETLYGFELDSIQSIKDIAGMGKIKIAEEYYIAPGDKVYVLGSAENRKTRGKDGTDKNENLLILKKGRHNICYISDKGERKIKEKHFIKIMLELYGGALLSLGGLALLLFSLRII